MPSELNLLASALLEESRYATMLSPNILPVYADLRDIIIWQQINAFQKDSTVNPLELELCATLLLRTEYHLAMFSYSNTFGGTNSVQVICSIIVPMFTVQTQLFLWRGTATMRVLVRQLQGILVCASECERCPQQEGPTLKARADVEGLWDEHTDLAIWTFLIGAFASAGDRARRSWFLFHCSKGVLRYRDRTGVTLTWSYVRGMLQRFFFVESLHGDEFINLWGEVFLLVNSA